MLHSLCSLLFSFSPFDLPPLCSTLVSPLLYFSSLSFQFFFLSSLSSLFSPPTETVFYVSLRFSRSKFPKFYISCWRGREEEEAEFRSAEHRPSPLDEQKAHHLGRASFLLSRWKTISTLVGVTPPPTLDDRISWRNCLGIEASPLASSSPEWLTVRFSVFLRSLREYSLPSSPRPSLRGLLFSVL